ncbi:protease [Rhizocola hellebori]|uniref:Protease n=1 Tax=Rhizocola hellebori TaxID=1392758 RepID=A0A8J3QKA5_9ACTN|nr:alpha/beta fold hydrolase [Rhizocola hellebori]GIH11314.1 protease [Rhizocola hellebori]
MTNAMTDFYSQQPAWVTSDFDPRVEVASVEAPMDYARPEGERITVAISRIKCTGGAKRRGMLLSLNGGPAGNWGQGIKLPLRFSYTPLIEHYDLIGMDPRGSGRSTPLYREDPQPLAGFNTRPSDEDFAIIADDARRMYEGCARLGGAYREQITSANIARDIDLIRAALGEERLSFVGYSGPTYIAAVYGTMFGSRVDRMVLDSARNPDVGWRGQFHAQVPAIYENIHAWAEWVSERHLRFGLGTSMAEVLDAAEVAAHQTDTTQFDVAIGFAARHRPLWGVLADAVAGLRDGGDDDAHAAVRKLASQDAWAPGEPQERVQSVTESATSEDDWPTDLESYFTDMRIAREKYPYGFGVSRFQPQVATFWTDRKMERPPQIVREGYGPGVVVHGAGNSMLTHADGEAMAKRLGFSMISVADEGQNEIFAKRGNKAVDDYVFAYLIDGVLPPERVTCAGPARPDIAPDAAGGATRPEPGTLVAQVETWIAANTAW